MDLITPLLTELISLVARSLEVRQLNRVIIQDIVKHGCMLNEPPTNNLSGFVTAIMSTELNKDWNSNHGVYETMLDEFTPKSDAEAFAAFVDGVRTMGGEGFPRVIRIFYHLFAFTRYLMIRKQQRTDVIAIMLRHYDIEKIVVEQVSPWVTEHGGWEAFVWHCREAYRQQ